MNDAEFQVPILFDYVATFTWAVSGAIVAIRRRLDITGVFVLALLAALGTPAFAVFGMQLAENAGRPLIAMVFVGVSNGVAGGRLRDVMVRPGQYASITLLVACGLYLLLTLQWALTPTTAAWITVAAFFVVRVLTIRFNWQTRSVWEEESGRRRL